MAAALPVYAFEGSRDLEAMPIAVRRALDHAGLRLTMEAWRSLRPDDRRELAQLGAADVVDTAGVSMLTQLASPGPSRFEPVPDPDFMAPPDELVRALEPQPLDARRWTTLRPLDRYALTYVYRRAVARGDVVLLRSAYDEVVAPVRVAAARAPEPTVSSLRETLVDPPEPAPPRLSAAAPARPTALGGGGRGQSDRPKSARLPTPPPARAYAPEAPAPPAPAVVSSHVTAGGDVHMVDVGAKPVTERRAIAQAVVRMQPDTLARIDQAPKGAVLATAKLAAIQAAKRTADLIPLCHPLRLTSIDVQAHLDVEQGQVTLLVTVAAWERTGVEMEALTAASVGALTVYDMLKSVDQQISITDVLLLGKEGGSSSPPASP